MFFSRRGRIERRLSSISSSIAQLRAELAVLEEQLHHLQVVEADTETESLIADNPAAQRELNAARNDRRRTETTRDRVRDRIDELTSEQDQLLEELHDIN